MIIMYYNNNKSIFTTDENPSDVKKIASVKRNAVREFCKKKNMEQHEKRLELPPTPPKPVT